MFWKTLESDESISTVFLLDIGKEHQQCEVLEGHSWELCESSPWLTVARTRDSEKVGAQRLPKQIPESNEPVNSHRGVVELASMST